MGKFDNIAILTDLDGTFLDDQTKVVKRNIDAIEYFKSEGGLFTLATGRMHMNLDRIIPAVDKLVNAPAVMCNGTYFYDFEKKKVFGESHMDAALAYKLVRFVSDLGIDGYIRGCGNEKYTVDAFDRRGEEHLKKYGITAYELVPYKEWNTEGYYKVVFEDGAENLIELENKIRAEFGDAFEYNSSRPTLLELQKNGVNKSSLLKGFKDIYAKQGRNITLYACGDNNNDLAMLREADVSVCPSNAIDEVKAICDICLCSNNEGVIADLIYSL